MSATYLYRPITDGVALPGNSSAFRQTIKRVFGDFPITLTRDDLNKLDVLRALEAGNNEEPFHELYAAVDKFGAIEVYAMY